MRQGGRTPKKQETNTNCCVNHPVEVLIPIYLVNNFFNINTNITYIVKMNIISLKKSPEIITSCSPEDNNKTKTNHFYWLKNSIIAKASKTANNLNRVYAN